MISETSVERREDTTSSGIHFRVSRTPQSADVLLMIMGYGGNMHMWPNNLINTLAKTYTVITLDNRGTGQSIQPKDPESYSAVTMAEDVHSIVEKLAIDRFHLLGFSLGGCIAQEYAHSYQLRLKSLFLLSTTGGGKLHVKPKRDKAEILAKPQGDTLWDEYVAVWKLCMSESVFEKNLSLLQTLFNDSSRYPTPPETLKGHMRVLEYFDAESYLQTLEIPTTVMHGQDDQLLPAKNAQLIAQHIQGSKLSIVADGQHYLHIEQPNLLLKEITTRCR